MRLPERSQDPGVPPIVIASLLIQQHAMQLLLRAKLGFTTSDFSAAYRGLAGSDDVLEALSASSGLSREECRLFIEQLVLNVDYPFPTPEAQA